MPLEKISYLKALKASKEVKQKEYDKVNVVFLRNFTLEPIEAYLALYLGQNQLLSDCSFGEFDAIIQDSLHNPIITPETNAVIVTYDIELAFESLFSRFNTLTAEEKYDVQITLNNFVRGTIKNIRARTNATIIWNSFLRPIYPTTGVADSQYNAYSVSAFVNTLNIELHQCCQEFDDVYIVDSEQMLARIGATEFFDIDKKLEYRAPYTNFALQCFSQQYATLIANQQGKMKKCLVLDCDNTLWEGIIGEDGIEGIGLGNSLVGKQFQQFQNYVLELSKHGVVLALCSKNNEQDVINVFEQHPEMTLKLDAISVTKINWQDKAENIRQIAKILNIGLDSVVFVDDSPIECELVRQLLPTVTTIQMTANPTDTLLHLKLSGLFDNLYFSSEDHQKTQQYKQQIKRTELKSSTSDIESYIKSLAIKLQIEQSPQQHSKRITQLCQKTNQFNLTTQRFTLTEVEQYIVSSDKDVFTCKVEDKFGNIGVIGAIFITYRDKGVAEINNLLISCRALGRKIEQALIKLVCHYINQAGYTKILAQRIPSAKNQQTEDFYPTVGFKYLHNEGGTSYFQLTTTCLPSNDVLSLFSVKTNFSN